VARPAWADPNPTRTRYRTPTTSYRGRRASDSPARNHANHPAPTTAVDGAAATADNPAAQFDPWGDTDPPEPGTGNHTHPPDDPPPGHRALHHANNPPLATTDRDRRNTENPIRTITEDAAAPG
ncbi:hypothetical protein ACFPJ1_31780, partial [Kribbella qitaiheensis]|uniref:hypothetical protein n=1 Tax=Kribbella qitaiheensis TaxID=1544730 RepID=UPI0036129088